MVKGLLFLITAVTGFIAGIPGKRPIADLTVSSGKLLCGENMHDSGGNAVFTLIHGVEQIGLLRKKMSYIVVKQITQTIVEFERVQIFHAALVCIRNFRKGFQHIKVFPFVLAANH